MTTFETRADLPRGLRNNNPGNIRPNPKYTWYGQKGTEHGYCIFDDIEHGIRAMAKDLKSKIGRGLNTMSKYIPVYAPPEDNNNTQGYINRVSKETGFNPNTVLTADKATLEKLVKAHIAVEVGDDRAYLITDAMISEGVAMALQ